MGSKSLEKFLFQKLNVVAIPPTQRIELFDVLVKTTDGFSHRLVNLGSFLLHWSIPHSDLRNENGETLSDGIKRGLKELEKDPYTKVLDEEKYEDIFNFYIEENVDDTYNISAESTLGAKVSQYLKGDLDRSKNMKYRLRRPAHLAISDVVLDSLFLNNPSCKPDMERFKLVRNLARDRKGGLELWIVKEKVYSESFEVNVAKNNSAGVSAALPEIAPGVEFGSNAKQTQSANICATGKFLVGFKAIRLFYDSQGVFQAHTPDMGKHLPTLRMGFRPSHNLNDPDYHMGGLFAQPPSEGDEDMSLTCLEIEPQTPSPALPPADAPEHV